jgi:hypothetical protein
MHPTISSLVEACSNLRRYVEALGGRLEITARFPDGAVTIADVGKTGEDENPR